MNKTIKSMATAMIIILVLILIWIFWVYSRSNDIIDAIIFTSGDSSVSTLNLPSGDYIYNGENNNIPSSNESLIESIIKDSNTPEKVDESIPNTSLSDNEKIHDSNISGEDIENKSGDNQNNNENSNPQTNNSGDSIPDTIIEIPEKLNEGAEQLVITSETQTSNQEKQEILTEIDKALQGLLEAVSKVETVDETKLDATLNSEVDKP